MRGKAAEDLALAQLVCERGMRGEIAIGPDDLSTRMYTSLAEVVNGWTKNMVTAGADSLPPGVLPRLLLPVLLLVTPLIHSGADADADRGGVRPDVVRAR